LVLQEDTGLEAFDLNRPADLPLIGAETPSGCLGWNLEATAGSQQDGLWLPLNDYGVDHLPIQR
jgi:hypothetical protein